MSEGRKHALLSASSASRWLTCTPSARLEEEFPDTTSEYAEEGTLAHEICELKVSQNYVKKQAKATFNKKLRALQKRDLYQKEMDGYTDQYLDLISKIVHSFKAPPHIAVEKRVDYSHIAPEGFGTADCVILGDRELHIVDFKYGKGVPVSAEDNTQLKLYALGAYQEYAMLYPIQGVCLHIAQPRIDNMSYFFIQAPDLLAWGEAIKPQAQLAYAGEGDFAPSESACRFCKAKGSCRARSDANLQLAQMEFKKPPLLSHMEVGPILKQADELANWAKDLKEWALSELLKGEEVPGWKAVEGRSNRAFADIDKAFNIIQSSGIADEAMLYERKPLTLTAVEKLIGKKEFKELLADQVVKPPGKPTLAAENDKREAITLKTSAEADFKTEE